MNRRNAVSTLVISSMLAPAAASAAPPAIAQLPAADGGNPSSSKKRAGRAQKPAIRPSVPTITVTETNARAQNPVPFDTSGLVTHPVAAGESISSA